MGKRTGTPAVRNKGWDRRKYRIRPVSSGLEGDESNDFWEVVHWLIIPRASVVESKFLPPSHQGTKEEENSYRQTFAGQPRFGASKVSDILRIPSACLLGVLVVKIFCQTN